MTNPNNRPERPNLAKRYQPAQGQQWQFPPLPGETNQPAATAPRRRGGLRTGGWITVIVATLALVAMVVWLGLNASKVPTATVEERQALSEVQTPGDAAPVADDAMEPLREDLVPPSDVHVLRTEDLLNVAQILQGDDSAPYARALAGADARELGSNRARIGRRRWTNAAARRATPKIGHLTRNLTVRLGDLRGGFDHRERSGRNAGIGGRLSSLGLTSCLVPASRSRTLCSGDRPSNTRWRRAL